ncbi:MAG: toll/interleukin-1 receptor domain-containing protein [Betaproteobacteria bacterium]
MSSDLPAAVFISHVSQEAALAALLKNAIARDFPGIDIFVSSDLGSIEVGTDWLPCIEHAINKSSVLIVLCSQDSIRRPWVNFELGAAWMRSIPIVPLCHTDLTPADLPMPLSVKDGLEANSSKELIRLYAVIARTMNVAIPKEHLPCLAKQVAEFEAAYKAANTREVVQFEYHLDLVVPGPGRLPEARIPSETLVESDAKSLELFGLLADGKRTWRDVEKTAKRNRDTRWLAQLQKSVHLASNGESFTPMQAIFHTNLGSYQPELARMDMMPNGSRRFHIHFVKTVVPPLADVPN